MIADHIRIIEAGATRPCTRFCQSSCFDRWQEIKLPEQKLHPVRSSFSPFPPVSRLHCLRSAWCSIEHTWCGLDFHGTNCGWDGPCSPPPSLCPSTPLGSFSFLDRPFPFRVPFSSPMPPVHESRSVRPAFPRLSTRVDGPGGGRHQDVQPQPRSTSTKAILSIARVLDVLPTATPPVARTRNAKEGVLGACRRDRRRGEGAGTRGRSVASSEGFET